MDFKTNYCSVQTLFSYGKHKQLYLCQDLAQKSKRGGSSLFLMSRGVDPYQRESGSGDIGASEFRFSPETKAEVRV